MCRDENARGNSNRIWITRIVLGAVFAVNVTCALAFILQPGSYAPGFEMEGVQGRIFVQGLGILFLMWNATYPPVLFRPTHYRTLFKIILVQQLIGLVGETWLWLTLPTGHPVLRATGLRFILFDGVGLIAMGSAYRLSNGIEDPARTD